MNEKQRELLTKGLMNLLAAQTNVIEARRFGKGKYTDRGKALALRKEIEDWIIRFVDEITYDTTDPRAGLRRCEVVASGCKIRGYFHGSYEDADREPCVKIEMEDGDVIFAYAGGGFRFTDIPQGEGEQ